MTVTSGSIKQVRILARASSSIKVLAVKLELGDTQTLAHQDGNGSWQLNEVPEYEVELLKCRHYYQRIRTYGSYAIPLAYGHVASETVARFVLSLPSTMRSAPTLTMTGVSFMVKSGSSSVTLTTQPTYFLMLGTMLYLTATLQTALPINAPAILAYYGPTDGTNYIEISADL
jgi:hypothetical protein